MRFSTPLTLAAAAGMAVAQEPSLCDKYTTALLMENNGTNQLTLLTLLVNTVVIGNYTQPNTGVAVPGILANGTGEYEGVSLLPYFNGQLASTNAGGSPRAVNFLDDGGAEPLMMNKPSNTENSRQYRLLTHLYQYFGALLGCSATGFPAYEGDASQFEVHKYMGLDEKEVGYFISQVGAAAASFGVEEADIQTVATALSGLFNVRCAPATAVIPAQGPQLQSICIAESCPLSPNATCSAYGADSFPEPQPAMPGNSSMPSGTPSGGAGATPTSGGATGTASPSGMFTGAAVAKSFGLGAVAAGAFAFLL